MGKKLSFLLVSFFVIFSFSKSFAVENHITEALKALAEKCRDYDCVYYQQNILRDTKICQPKKEIAFGDPLLSRIKKITGHILYEGVWPAKYSYSVVPSKVHGYEIVVKVHFKNQNLFDAKVLDEVQVNLNLAAEIWREKVPNNLFQFKFLVVKNAKEADFSVRLTGKISRGPYYSEWSNLWQPAMYAHEIGHMMGLDDEYGTVLIHDRCNERSLMCDDVEGRPREYHYYQILKRTHCN